MVLPTSVELIDDIRKAPDDVLGTRELFREVRMNGSGQPQHVLIPISIVLSVGLHP